MRKKSTAALLAFFFGGMGAHKYYLGRVGQGVLFSLTLGIVGIGSLINFIQLLCMSESEFNSRYNGVNQQLPGNPPSVAAPV